MMLDGTQQHITHRWKKYRSAADADEREGPDGPKAIAQVASQTILTVYEVRENDVVMKRGNTLLHCAIFS